LGEKDLPKQATFEGGGKKGKNLEERNAIVGRERNRQKGERTYNTAVARMIWKKGSRGEHLLQGKRGVNGESQKDKASFEGVDGR